MEMDLENQEKKGVFARVWGWITGLVEKFKERVVEIAKQTKKIGKDDPRRIIHSAKVGLALTLVSLFYYFRPLYDGFGQAGMWAVLTVVVVFEFSVGGTLCKSINRGFATLFAGALGVGTEYLAELSGKQGEPIMLGFFVFILAAVSTFTRFFPHIKRRYDYGVLIFILTFSLVAVSGYRVDEIIQLAHQRLSTIIIGGATCMVISMLICPVWAGQDLHNLITTNVEKLASFLEGFGDEYFNFPDDEESSNVSKKDKSFLQGYKSVLNSKASEESLANFAWWEPGHGRFGFRRPWKQYLKIGVLSRQCACHIEALSGYMNSKLEIPTEFLRIIQEPCVRMSSESGKALKELSQAMKNMTNPSTVETHVRNSKTAIDDLRSVLESTSLEKADLLEIIPAVTVSSILIDIIKCVENISESISELSNLAHFKNIPKSSASSEKQQQQQQQQHQLLHRGIVQPVNDADGDDDHVVIAIRGTSQDSPEIIENAQATQKRSQQVEV